MGLVMSLLEGSYLSPPESRYHVELEEESDPHHYTCDIDLESGTYYTGLVVVEELQES